jgi:hypothetical protein
MISLPSVRAPDPNKPLASNYRPNNYFHFHQRNGHDMKHCKHLKNPVQYLIDSNQLKIRGVNDQGNKFVASPNEKFTNPMLKHNISFVKPSETKNGVMNVDIDDENIKYDNEYQMDKVVEFITL